MLQLRIYFESSRGLLHKSEPIIVEILVTYGIHNNNCAIDNAYCANIWGIHATKLLSRERCSVPHGEREKL